MKQKDKKNQFLNIPIDVIHTYLSQLKEMDSSTFASFFDYFSYHVQQSTYSNDDLCRLASYLIHLNVNLASDKYHGFPGKKMALLNYFHDHFSLCSDDAKNDIYFYQEEMQKYYKQKKKEQGEKELREHYPELYQELIELREYQKVKN